MRETADCFLHGPYDAALVRCPHPDHARSDKFRCTPHSVAGAAKDAGGSAGAPPPAARRQPSPSTARDSDAVSETHADSPTVHRVPLQDDLEGKPIVSRHEEPQDGPQEWECGCITACYVTDRDPGDAPFEMRLWVACDAAVGVGCQPRGAIRSRAVELVDAKYGHTLEFAGSPAAHRAEYDEAEAALLEGAEELA